MNCNNEPIAVKYGHLICKLLQRVQVLVGLCTKPAGYNEIGIHPIVRKQEDDPGLKNYILGANPGCTCHLLP